jgi:hypothetical protein
MGRIRAFALAVAVCLAAAVFASTAGAQTGTFTGEQLVVVDYDDFTGTTFDCNAEGSTVVFTATGPALGPYPGTYEETVRVTTGPLTVLETTDQYGDPIYEMYGHATAIDAEFRIVSGDTVITGTKELTSPEQTSFYCKRARSAECDEVSFFVYSEGEALAYEALIGGRTDTGTSDLSASFGPEYECGGEIQGFASGVLYESFVRSFSPAYTYEGVCRLAREFADTAHGANGLCATLGAAEASAARGDTEATRGQLGAFANQVRARTGGELTADEAKTLLAAAETLLGH